MVSSAVITLLSGSALAADLPSRQAPPVFVPPTPFSWTGAYIGGQVGYGFGHDTSSIFFAPTGFVGASYGESLHGIIGGAHVGYNFAPLGGGVVVGLEGDVDGSDYRRTTSFGPASIKVASPIGGSIRGRLGFAVDRALFYATGGAAFATFTDTYIVPGFGTGFDKPSSTRVGYTVGGGVEYAITNTWSLRGEYRYSGFGSYIDPLSGIAGGVVAVRHSEIEQRAQVGFSYKFETLAPPPVVAKY
jgi:outer membrane immunogenic protein